MSYVKVYGDFNKEFNTYVIAYCVDTNSWFITKQRYWYFQFDNEFNTYNEALEFFGSNQDMILDQQHKMEQTYKPSTKVILEN
jgi:hypothetical protein